MQIKKVILVFKTHFDIGFTKLSREVLDDYAGKMLDRVAETCDATRDMGALKYVWTMPAWPLKTMRDRAPRPFVSRSILLSKDAGLKHT